MSIEAPPDDGRTFGNDGAIDAAGRATQGDAVTDKTTFPPAYPTLDELMSRWRSAARRVSHENSGSPAFDAATENLIEARDAYDLAVRQLREDRRREG